MIGWSVGWWLVVCWLMIGCLLVDDSFDLSVDDSFDLSVADWWICWLVDQLVDVGSFYQISGAVWKLRWPSGLPVPNKSCGFCGCKATFKEKDLWIVDWWICLSVTGQLGMYTAPYLSNNNTAVGGSTEQLQDSGDVTPHQVIPCYYRRCPIPCLQVTA